VAKPFSIQSPEAIAKEYAGNKQQIAQAMQMGVVDPTAGVLAGMFIDRMRAAQMQEQAPQTTVAQQVMGGAPSAAPVPPLPAGGLGDIPQAAPPMAPDMGMGMPPEAGMGMPPQVGMPPEAGMAPPMPEGAPVGMAEGGLAMLPVPETMFDEPTNGGFNDGYAGGGLVAFSRGGNIDRERLRRALLMQESGGDYGVMNREGSGAMGGYQFMPDTARALAKRLGVEYRPDLMSGKKGRSKEGIEYQERLMDAQMEDILAFSKGDVGRAGIYHFAGPNEKGWGPKTRKYQEDILRRYSGSKDSGELPERDLGTAEGRSRSIDDYFGALQQRFGPTPEEEEVRDRRRARAEEMASPEFYEKERKAALWETLAEIGFNMASSKSPSLLQAVGEAAAAALPGAKLARKERDQLKDRALDAMEAMNDKSRKENRELLGLAFDAYKTGLSQEQFAETMQLKRQELAALEARTAEEINLKRMALAAQQENKKQFDQLADAYRAAYPGFSDFQVFDLMRKDGLIGRDTEGFPGDTSGGGSGEGIAVLSSRPAQ
jgi:hypothetical protein